MNLYITGDKVGITTGGGSVTAQECEALKSMGEVEILSRDELVGGSDPWGWDDVALRIIQERTIPHNYHGSLKIAHFYAGCFGQTVEELQGMGVRVAYTVAAHRVEDSRKEHESYGVDYKSLYPHLNEPGLFRRYIAGYRNADCVVVPSSHSRDVVREQGCTQRVEYIAHGCHIPDSITSPSEQFIVGYLGVCTGPDKGVKYLLQAWKKLGYKDSVLILAGRDSVSQQARHMVYEFGGGNIQLRGWVADIADFYSSISLYVQPSATEGFGLEVVEALAHGRKVLCSTGAGACDVVPQHWRFPRCDVNALAEAIDHVKREGPEKRKLDGQYGHEMARPYSWDRIRQRYVSLWRSMP